MSNWGRRQLPMLVLLGMVAFPQQTSANAGTPLMWATALHLMVGNALIGVGEGLLLAWLFKAKKERSVPIMMVANYFSAWIGATLLHHPMLRNHPLDLTNAWQWLLLMTGLTFLLTIILEWPFVSWAIRGQRRRALRSLGASCVIQTASYSLLLGWYVMASQTSLYTAMTVVKPVEMFLPATLQVYDISPTDGAVYLHTLSDGSSRKVFDLRSTNMNDQLFLRESLLAEGGWDLLARLENAKREEQPEVEVAANLQVLVAKGLHGVGLGTWFSFGAAPVLENLAAPEWEFKTGFWSAEGLTATHKHPTQRCKVAWETPYTEWPMRQAQQIATDKVLFQLGGDQICVFDPAARRIALLWHGRSPVVVLPKDSWRLD